MKQILLIALVAAILLFGCAGSSTPPANQPAAQNNQPSANGQQPPAGSNQQPANQPPAPPGGNMQAPPDADPFNSLLNSLSLASGWKVAYVITVTGVDTPIQTQQYVKGTDKFRSDMTVQGMESRSYVIGKDVYSCNNAQGAWTCITYSGAVTGTDSADLKKNLETDKSKYTVTADGTMQVAGVTATCFRVVSADGTSRYCVAPEGVPLYVKSTSTSNGKEMVSEMTATSYSTSVSDADFTLPATPQAMPSLPSGGDVCSYCNYLTGTDKSDCLASCSSG